MRSLSHFQTLPTHIVRSTVDYAFNTYEVSFDTDMSYALSLLHSCHRWRSAFIRRACATLWLITSKADKPVYRFPSWPDQLCLPFFQAESMVKTFKVFCEGWSSITSGDALQWVILSEYAGTTLSSAHSFLFSVSPCYSLYDPPKSEISSMATNAGAFLQYTRSMVPNASSVEIDWNNRLFERQDSNSVTVLSRYASTAVKGAKNLVFLEYDNQGLSTQLDTSVIGGLTQLLYKYCTAHLWFKEILVRSSHILEHLSILYMPQTCIDDILLTSAGTPIVYPALRKLYLDPIVESLVSNEFSKELANSSTTHFPVLKELRIIGTYPFSSNVFTRCPNTTIESLHIAITPTFIQQQGLFMAIASSQFISLKTLVIVNRLMEDDDTALQFIKTTTKMSTTLHSFEFSGFLDSGLLLKSMSAFSMSVTLRFIRIRNVEVEFSDLILLLKHFPLLCTADIMLNGNIPAIDGINSKDLADYIGRVIYPLNINFNMLCLRNIQPMEPEYLGETIALLAIGCPRMARCATGNQNKELLEQKIRTLASSNSYFEYSKRLLMVKISP